MHNDDLAPPDLDIPFSDLNIPFVKLELDDLPSIDEVLKTSQATLSPPSTVGQTLYSERISIRIPRWILAEIKKRAATEGEKYQTYINLILSQHARS